MTTLLCKLFNCFCCFATKKHRRTVIRVFDCIFLTQPIGTFSIVKHWAMLIINRSFLFWNFYQFVDIVGKRCKVVSLMSYVFRFSNMFCVKGKVFHYFHPNSVFLCRQCFHFYWWNSVTQIFGFCRRSIAVWFYQRIFYGKIIVKYMVWPAMVAAVT